MPDNQTMFDIWRSTHIQSKEKFANKSLSFLENLMPEMAVGFGVFEVLQILESRFGSASISSAIDPSQTIESPMKAEVDAEWLKSSRMVGINVRTIGNFFNIIKYLLTLSAEQNAIHILPIWEPGVVSSLYGKTSWNINKEFFSEELLQALPNANTVEKQLKIVTNLIHMMGKTVGLDVIPHTDRFSELVFVHPNMFDWVHRHGASIVNVSNDNYKHIQEVVWDYLVEYGTADGSNLAYGKLVFFDEENPILNEEQKFSALFGLSADTEKRLNRRLELMQKVLYAGYETLPVTMAPPYTGLFIEEGDFIQDEIGNKWYNYKFKEPQKMSRVFGPLTRYKFFETNPDQSLDFEKPNVAAWKYVNRKYFECQQQFNFDFMRGDMAHVQPRKDGVPSSAIPTYYDPLKSIKQYIQQKGVPYFGFYAETFLAPDDTMGYGNEIAHLEAIKAEVSLGDIQSAAVGSDGFMEVFERYSKIESTVVPSFTMITADKDDPRFDSFYLKGKHLRYFVGMFLQKFPSYMSLGFECRNAHQKRGLNEEYSKLYVFNIQNDADTDKVTHGPYIWGSNTALFLEIQKIKTLADQFVLDAGEMILNEPGDKVQVWDNGAYRFVCNFDPKLSLKYDCEYELLYSSSNYSKYHECRVYKR